MAYTQFQQRVFTPIRRTMRRVAIVAGCFGIFFISSIETVFDFRANNRRFDAEISEFVATAGPAFAVAIENGDLDTAKQIVDQLIKRPELLEIALYNSQNSPLYNNLKPVSTSTTETYSSQLLSVSPPKRTIGYLRITYTRDKAIKDAFSEFYTVLSLTTLKFLLIYGVFAYLLRRDVIEPINHLARAIAELPETPSSLYKSSLQINQTHGGRANEIDMVAQFIARRESRLQELIYDLRTREETLRDSESHQRELVERLEFILQANKLGSWDINLTNGIATYNKRWGDMLGVSNEHMLNLFDFWKSRVHPGDLPALEGAIDDHVSGKAPSIQVIHRLRHSDGHWIWVLCTGTGTHRDSSGTATHIVGTNFEITDLVKAKEEALAANKAKSEFLANMSHEIRTPLNGVLGMTSLLKRTTLDPSQSEFIKTIELSGKQLLSVISDILDLSKIEAGKLELSPVKTNVVELVDNVIKILNPAAQAKGLELIKTVHDEIPSLVLCDDTRLQQVLVNLVNNAIKFTSKGQINIELKVIQCYLGDHSVELEFHVIDQGIGIPEQNLKNLFKAFSQADATVTRKFGGTGLGLAISKQIVEMMHGKIRVKSKEGVGSDFYFTVRLRVASLQNQMPTAS